MRRALKRREWLFLNDAVIPVPYPKLMQPFINPTQKRYVLLAALTGWFAVISQLVLMLQNGKTAPAETIIRFFSYFTILSNLLITIGFSSMFLEGTSKAGRFFRLGSTQTALTLYIIIVSAVYNTVLRSVWHPQGVQKITNELMHSVIPLVAVAYWWFFVPKRGLQWTDSFRWLLYPLVYAIFIAARGAYSGFYPYPFLDVTAIGYPKALTNGGIIGMLILLLSLVLIAIAKLTGNAEKQSN